MPIESLFATRVYGARLQGGGALRLRAQLLRECRQLRLDDRAGRRWSAANYPGGYTSSYFPHISGMISREFSGDGGRSTEEYRLGHAKQFEGVALDTGEFG